MLLYSTEIIIILPSVTYFLSIQKRVHYRLLRLEEGKKLAKQFFLPQALKSIYCRRKGKHRLNSVKVE